MISTKIYKKMHNNNIIKEIQINNKIKIHIKGNNIINMINSQQIEGIIASFKINLFKNNNSKRSLIFKNLNEINDQIFIKIKYKSLILNNFLNKINNKSRISIYQKIKGCIRHYRL